MVLYFVGSFKGDIDINIDIDVDMDMDVDIWLFLLIMVLHLRVGFISESQAAVSLVARPKW